MKGKIFYITDSDSELIASIGTPVVKQSFPKPVTYTSEAYDDYGVSGLYPSYNFGFLLIILGVIAFLVQVFLFMGVIWVFITRKKSIRCKYCHWENYKINGEFPEVCAYCGKKLEK